MRKTVRVNFSLDFPAFSVDRASGNGPDRRRIDAVQDCMIPVEDVPSVDWRCPLVRSTWLAWIDTVVFSIDAPSLLSVSY